MRSDAVIADDRPPFTWWPVAVLVAIKLAVVAACLTEYGWFRDELYYLASTDHLALGFVDHPPLSIALLAAWTAIFGDSLATVRSLALIAGACTIVLAALIAREVGGRWFAQFLAGFAVLASPLVLGSQFIYSMNVVDQAFSALALLLYARLLRRGDTRTSVVLGAVLGAALLNKLSALWLAAGMLAGLLLTAHRALLARRGVWLGMAVSALLFLPHVIWQIAHGVPTVEFVRNAAEHKMVSTGWLEFWRHQFLDMNPISVPIWLAGVVVPLVWRPMRQWGPLSIVFVTVAAILLAGASKAYYLATAYFGVYGMGAVIIERWTPRLWGRFARATLVLGMLKFAILAAPLAIPILPVERLLAHLSTLGLTPRAEERQELGALPQQFADMHGWPELVDAVERAASHLTPEERRHAVVFGQNYGEAGAVDVLGRARGLPRAVSGHNSYWMWGPGADSVAAVIVIGGDLEDNREVFESFEIVDSTKCDWCMPYENNLPIGIGRRMKGSVRELWPRVRFFI